MNAARHLARLVAHLRWRLACAVNAAEAEAYAIQLAGLEAAASPPVERPG